MTAASRLLSLLRPLWRRPVAPWPGRGPVEPVGGQAARMMSDGLWIEGLDAAGAAEAMRRPAEWVVGVAGGTIDPTLDELEVSLNAIGLETRIDINTTGPLRPMHARHNREKLAEKIARHRALGEVWIQRGPPQPGAKARLFSAGPGRTDGGGWAAILTRQCLWQIGVTVEQFAARAGIAPDAAARLASGDWKPQAGHFERILAACGVPMAIRLEEYDPHDDYEQAEWEADPEGYEKQIEAIREEIQSWEPIDAAQSQTMPTSS